MKIDKFDYKKTKKIIFDTIDGLMSNNKITDGSFSNSYYVLAFEDIKREIDFLTNKLKSKHNIDLVDFFEKNKDKIYSDPEFTGHSAFVDTLLYSFDNKNGILYGIKLDDASEIEFLIKYKYGYYQYDMGRKYILQSYDSMEDYYKATAENIMIGLLAPDNNQTDISMEFGLYLTVEQAESIIEKSSMVRKYNNGYTVYIHLLSLYSELLRISDDDVKYDDFINCIERDFHNIPKRLFDGMLEVYIGYKNNKISLQEFDEIKGELSFSGDAYKYNL